MLTWGDVAPRKGIGERTDLPGAFLVTAVDSHP
jgi:hypothetical protein